MRYRSIGATVLLTLLGTGCNSPSLSSPDDLPEGPVTPVTPTLVGAVLYGTYYTNSVVVLSPPTFEVLSEDCTTTIEGVSAENRLPLGKKKLTYKYQLTVDRLPFVACVRVRSFYAYGPEQPFQMVEATTLVRFNTQGAGLAAVGTQVDLPLPR